MARSPEQFFFKFGKILGKKQNKWWQTSSLFHQALKYGSCSACATVYRSFGSIATILARKLRACAAETVYAFQTKTKQIRTGQVRAQMLRILEEALIGKNFLQRSRSVYGKRSNVSEKKTLIFVNDNQNLFAEILMIILEKWQKDLTPQLAPADGKWNAPKAFPLFLWFQSTDSLCRGPKHVKFTVNIVLRA